MKTAVNMDVFSVENITELEAEAQKNRVLPSKFERFFDKDDSKNRARLGI